MIFIQNPIYLTVWKVDKFEKHMELRASTSERKRNPDGTPGEHVDSSWFPRIIGHAFNTMKDTLKPGDHIIATKSKITNELYEKTGKSYLRFTIMEASIDESRPNSLNKNTEPTKEEVVVEAKSGSAEGEDNPW